MSEQVSIGNNDHQEIYDIRIDIVNGNFIKLTTFKLPLTTIGAASDENFAKMTTFQLQCAISYFNGLE